MLENIDQHTVDGFGYEWSRFDQSELSTQELETIFDDYFAIFPWSKINKDAIGFDLGCGSGRWAKGVAPRVGLLHCIDASEAALEVATKNLSTQDNCKFHLGSVAQIPLAKESMDFGYSLGVLHHVPNTFEGIKACVDLLKPKAPLLLYLYYAFDNKPIWFRIIWQISDIIRQVISQVPHKLRYGISQLIAALVYFPLARCSLLLDKIGVNVESVPLSAYRNRSFYVMRTDALDRFGTKLEQRFTQQQITQMMSEAGLENIVFSNRVPYWCAVGYKK